MGWASGLAECRECQYRHVMVIEIETNIIPLSECPSCHKMESLMIEDCEGNKLEPAMADFVGFAECDICGNKHSVSIEVKEPNAEPPVLECPDCHNMSSRVVSDEFGEPIAGDASGDDYDVYGSFLRDGLPTS